MVRLTTIRQCVCEESLTVYHTRSLTHSELWALIRLQDRRLPSLSIWNKRRKLISAAGVVCFISTAGRKDFQAAEEEKKRKHVQRSGEEKLQQAGFTEPDEVCGRSVFPFVLLVHVGFTEKESG